MKIGIIGAGVVSGYHLVNLSKIPEVEMEIIADLNEEARNRLADKHGITKRVADYKQVIEDENVEVVYVFAPHYLHCSMVIEAFQAGKHVVCEKPFAMNADEADKMIAAAEKAGKKLLIAENFRFNPTNVMTRKLLSEEKIGKPFMCMSTFIGNEIVRMSDPDNWKGTKDKAGGGVIIDNGFHMIDTLCSFFGDVESVQATAGRLLVKAENKEEDTALIILKFASNVLVELSLTFVAEYNGFPPSYMGAGFRYDLYGEKGSIHLVNQADTALTLVTESGRQVSSAQEVSQNLGSDAKLNMHRHFVDCIMNDAEPVITTRDARQAMRVIDACYESAKTGERVVI